MSKLTGKLSDEKLNREVNESLQSMARDRVEMTDLSRALNSDISSFEDDFIKNMSKEEMFTKGPMKMTQLIEQVDTNANYALNSLQEVTVNFLKLQEELNAELADITIEQSENEKLNETLLEELPSQQFNKKIQNTSNKLSKIFNKGKVHYDIMKTLAPLNNDNSNVWNGLSQNNDINSKQSDGNNNKADAMKSVENSIVSALQQKIIYLQNAITLLTSQKHSKQVQL